MIRRLPKGRGLFRSGDFQEAYRRAGDVLKFSQALSGQDALVADSQVRVAMIAAASQVVARWSSICTPEKAMALLR